MFMLYKSSMSSGVISLMVAMRAFIYYFNFDDNFVITNYRAPFCGWGQGFMFDFTSGVI